MPVLNFEKQIVRLKIVYYGPGLSGKTTNLQMLHRAYPQGRRGELVQLDTDVDRTLYFDYFPGDLGNMGNFQIKLDFFTVPGQLHYNHTRRMVLDGVDGLVFVADSSPEREVSNLRSLQNLQENLASFGRDLGSVPHVFQWNKRDLRRCLPIATLESDLNLHGAPSNGAIAISRIGVWETQRKIVRLTLKSFRTNQSRMGVRSHV